MNSSSTIQAYFDKDVPRYGDSYVFKAYQIKFNDGKIEYTYPNDNKIATDIDLESDLSIITDYYKKVVSIEATRTDSVFNQGLFYMEKQLEDFIVHNWDKTELGKRVLSKIGLSKSGRPFRVGNLIGLFTV